MTQLSDAADRMLVALGLDQVRLFNAISNNRKLHYHCNADELRHLLFLHTILDNNSTEVFITETTGRHNLVDGMERKQFELMSDYLKYFTGLTDGFLITHSKLIVHLAVLDIVSVYKQQVMEQDGVNTLLNTIATALIQDPVDYECLEPYKFNSLVQKMLSTPINMPEEKSAIEKMYGELEQVKQDEERKTKESQELWDALFDGPLASMKDKKDTVIKLLGMLGISTDEANLIILASDTPFEDALSEKLGKRAGELMATKSQDEIIEILDLMAEIIDNQKFKKQIDMYKFIVKLGAIKKGK